MYIDFQLKREYNILIGVLSDASGKSYAATINLLQ